MRPYPITRVRRLKRTESINVKLLRIFQRAPYIHNFWDMINKTQILKVTTVMEQQLIECSINKLSELPSTVHHSPTSALIQKGRNLLAQRTQLVLAPVVENKPEPKWSR